MFEKILLDDRKSIFDDDRHLSCSFGEARLKVMRVLSMMDEHFDIMNNPEAVNPEKEFNRMYNSGKLKVIPRDEKSKLSACVMKIARYYGYHQSVSVDELTKNIIVVGSLKGRTLEESILDFVKLAEDYITAQHVYFYPDPVDDTGTDDNDWMQELEYDTEVTEDVSKSPAKQEVHLSAFDKAQEIINACTRCYNTYPARIVITELKRDGYSEEESREAVMNPKLDWVPLAEGHIAEYDNIYRKPSESLRRIENCGYSIETIEKVKLDNAFWARRASVHLFDKFACRPETTEQIALDDLKSLGYSDKQASEALKTCGLKFASELEVVDDDIVEEFLAGEDAENAAKAKSDNVKPEFRPFSKNLVKEVRTQNKADAGSLNDPEKASMRLKLGAKAQVEAEHKPANKLFEQAMREQNAREKAEKSDS